MTEEGLRLLKKAGMYRCLLAVDTVTPRIQKMMGRNSDVAKTLGMIDLAHELGIMVHGTFIIGFPTETRQEAEATLKAAIGSKLNTVAIHRAIPFHGTELYRIAKEAGAPLQAEEEQYDFSKDSADVNASMIPNEVLIQLRKRAYRRFYLSPQRIWGIFRLLPNKKVLLPQLFKLWVRKAILQKSATANAVAP
jgi:radical SAM superfamily enzyme